MLGEHAHMSDQPAFSSRQMNGQVVHKTLSFLKELHLLNTASVLEDTLSTILLV